MKVARWMWILVALWLSFMFSFVHAGTVSLPKTGQTACYDAFGTVISCANTGQDGEKREGVAWPSTRFTVSGDCVTDNLTGLMWAQNGNLPNGTRTWQGALDYVASINSGSGLCGYNDWRLPNANEIRSLVHWGQSNTAAWLINTQGFTFVQFDRYWSSSTYAVDTNWAWNVNMLFGITYGNSKDNNYYVWPVRGTTNGTAKIPQTGQTPTSPINPAPAGSDGALQKGVSWPNPRFTSGANSQADCIYDDLTGLMWAKNGNLPNGTRTWQGALDYVASINSGSGLCGHNDWRLPNANEIGSLVHWGQVNTATWLNTQGFNSMQDDYYWTSTTNPNVNSLSCAIASNGAINAIGKTSSHRLLPVRCNSHPYGMVAWWRGEDDFNDSASGYNGSAIGGTTFTTGYKGKAFILDGTSQSISVPDGIIAYTDRYFTVSAWVNSAEDKSALIFYGGANTGEYYMGRDKQTNGTFFYLAVNIVGQGQVGAMSTETSTENTWYHVVGVRRGTSVEYGSMAS